MSGGHVIPDALIHAPAAQRIAWLLEDMEADEQMAGVPRYQPRYTDRERQITSLLAAVAIGSVRRDEVDRERAERRWTKVRVENRSTAEDFANNRCRVAIVQDLADELDAAGVVDERFNAWANGDRQCCQYWPNGHATDCPNMYER